MNFEFIATYVELQDVPSYSTNITVEGQLLKLSFLWNERIGKRVLSIKNTSDVVYLQNTILHPNEPLELNSNAVLDDLPYSVTLVKTGDNKVGNIFNWSKDFILCFSRTVDLDVKKLNVVYGVTTPSTPILPKPDPIFGDWILNQEFTILEDDIRYTGYKTNGTDTYDSFALSNLQDALVKSLLDPDLQQWQAVNDAIGQLTGASSWTFDNAAKVVRYMDSPTAIQPYDQYYYDSDSAKITPSHLSRRTAEAACKAFADWTQTPLNPDYLAYSYVSLRSDYYDNPSNGTGACLGTAYNKYSNENYGSYSWDMTRHLNPNYDPNYVAPTTTITYQQVADKIITNSNVADQGISLLAEAYLEAVADSIFSSDESKQFVKLEDLIPQLEANKVLR